MKRLFILYLSLVTTVFIFGQGFDPYKDAINNVPIPGTYDKIHKVKNIYFEFGKGQPIYGISVSKTNENGLIYNVVTKDGYVGFIMGDYLTVPCDRYTYFSPTWNAKTYAIVATPVLRGGKPIEKQYMYYTVVSAVTGKETIPIKALKYDLERDPLNDDPIFVAHLVDGSKRKFLFDGTEVTDGLPKEVKAVKIGDLYGIQSDGKVTANAQWLELLAIAGSRSFLAKMKNDKGEDRYGLVNHKGRVLVPLVFETAEHLGTGVKFEKQGQIHRDRVYMNHQGASVSPIMLVRQNVKVTGHANGDPLGAKKITDEEMRKITQERIDKYNMEVWGYDSKARREFMHVKTNYYNLFKVYDINGK